MEPVFSLVKDYRLRTVDDLVGHFLATMRRQAMHENRIRGQGHQFAIDTIWWQNLAALLLVLDTHRHPSVGHHAIDALDRRANIIKCLDRRATFARPINEGGIGQILRGQA